MKRRTKKQARAMQRGTHIDDVALVAHVQLLEQHILVQVRKASKIVNFALSGGAGSGAGERRGRRREGERQ